MALNVQKGVLTAPGATGNQTYSLPANFDPKYIIMWMTYQTADGVANIDGQLSYGVGTYDGGAAQQWYTAYYSDDASAAQVLVRSFNSAAILKNVIADGTTADYDIRFVSFTTGSTSNFTINYFDLPGTGSLLIHYMVFGGSDITRARAGNTTASTAAATQDITVTSGFGKPDVIMIGSNAWTDTGHVAGSNRTVLGWAKSSDYRRSATFGGTDATATMEVARQQGKKLFYSWGSLLTTDFEVDLAVKETWPTDGFRFNFTDQGTFAVHFGYLAINGNLNVSLGNAPAALGTTTDRLAADMGAPKGAMFWGTNGVGNSGTIVTADLGNLGGFWIGGMDGTNEGCAGVVQTDEALVSEGGSFFSSTKAIQHYVGSAGSGGTLTSEADAAISGDSITVTWNDADTVARDYNYIIFSDSTKTSNAPKIVNYQSPQSAGLSVGGLG